MIAITRALVAEHQMFCAMFTGVLANLSGLGEVKRLARLVEGLLRVHGGGGRRFGAVHRA